MAKIYIKEPNYFKRINFITKLMYVLILISAVLLGIPLLKNIIIYVYFSNYIKIFDLSLNTGQWLVLVIWIYKYSVDNFKKLAEFEKKFQVEFLIVDQLKNLPNSSIVLIESQIFNDQSETPILIIDKQKIFVIYSNLINKNFVTKLFTKKSSILKNLKTQIIFNNSILLNSFNDLIEQDIKVINIITRSNTQKTDFDSNFYTSNTVEIVEINSILEYINKEISIDISDHLIKLKKYLTQ